MMLSLITYIKYYIKIPINTIHYTQISYESSLMLKKIATAFTVLLVRRKQYLNASLVALDW